MFCSKKVVKCTYFSQKRTDTTEVKSLLFLWIIVLTASVPGGISSVFLNDTSTQASLTRLTKEIPG